MQTTLCLSSSHFDESFNRLASSDFTVENLIWFECIMSTLKRVQKSLSCNSYVEIFHQISLWREQSTWRPGIVQITNETRFAMHQLTRRGGLTTFCLATLSFFYDESIHSLCYWRTPFNGVLSQETWRSAAIISCKWIRSVSIIKRADRSINFPRSVIVVG